VDEILAGSFIPTDATTMPPGMKMPIYYQPFWGSQYQIRLTPRSMVRTVDFDTNTFNFSQPDAEGLYGYSFGGNRTE
jgi:hypothetical protein